MKLEDLKRMFELPDTIDISPYAYPGAYDQWPLAIHLENDDFFPVETASVLMHCYSKLPKVINTLRAIRNNLDGKIGDSLSGDQMAHLGIYDMINEINSALKDAEEVEGI